MSEIKENLIANAKNYQDNGISKMYGDNPEFKQFYREAFEHLNKKTIQTIKSQTNEKIIGYWPIYFSFGEKRRYVTSGSGNMSQRISGSFGTGYICLSTKNIYLITLKDLSKIYPMFNDTGFGWRVLSSVGNRPVNDRKRIEITKTFVLEFEDIKSVEIAPSDDSVTDDELIIQTNSTDWVCHHHFRETLPIIREAIKMGISGELDGIWNEQKKNEFEDEVLGLIKKLDDLREVNVITEEEFQTKKKELLNKL